MSLPGFSAEKALGKPLCSYGAATFDSSPFYGVTPAGCVPGERCEKRKSDHRCDVHGNCVSDSGHTCYELFECDRDGKWAHWSCHYLPGTYPNCPF